MTPAVENPPAEEEANAEGKKSSSYLKEGYLKISTLTSYVAVTFKARNYRRLELFALVFFVSDAILRG